MKSLPYTCLSLVLACCSVSASGLPDMTESESKARVDFAQLPQLQHIRAMVNDLSAQMNQVMGAIAANSDEFIGALEVQQESELPPEPVASHDTVVDCTQGLFFDATNSFLNYLGQVRLRDPRLHLNCESLILQLEKRRVNQETVQMGGQLDQPAKLDLNPNEESQSEPVIDETVLTSPISMDAKQVFVDMQQRRIYASGDAINIKHSRGEFCVKGGDSSALIDDAEGVIYLQGAQISGFSISETGERSEFSTEGYVLYLLDLDSLLLAKNNYVKTPQAALTCRGLLRLKMIAEPEQGKSGGLRLNRSYQALSYVTALDDVVITGTHADGKTYELKGDLLSYDAQKGEFIMTGEQCSLAFDTQTMNAQGNAMARLYADGSVKVKGDDISGDYQRASQTNQELLTGRYQTKGEISMPAADGQLHFPSGLKAQDAELDFSCTSDLVIEFERDLSVVSKQEKSSLLVLPRLQFSNLKGIAQVYASGDVQAKGLGEFDMFAQGESFSANLLAGTAQIKSKPAQWAQFTYQGAQLKARSEDAAADLQLLTNGDIIIEGDVIEGYMPDKDNQSGMFFETQKSVVLRDAESLLVMDYPVRLQTSQGIFSSQGGIQALLRKELKYAEKEATQAGFARLQFNYVGLERADAMRDSAFQSAQLSMQCDGPMHIMMTEEGQIGKDVMLKGLKYAEANGNVRFMAKDNQGDLYRATGDQLSVDGIEGTKRLSGNRVTLNSSKKAHEASGAGAQVLVDAQNNVTLSGASQTSVVSDIKEQMGEAYKKDDSKSKTKTTKNVKP